MGNMPVIKDLIVDMDAVHWKKIQRVTPWLINKEPIPEREYIVPRESMVDVTQSMACIQCGACVSDCLSMEVDPLFIGPAALAKAYRFVGDPRDAEQYERLKDLAEDPHGIYDCTHCFKCIEACPKGVAPMSQIMRLRRRAGDDHDIKDRNNGYRHEHAFVTNIAQATACCTRPTCCRDSYGGNSFGKFARARCPSWSTRCRSITKALLRRKVTPARRAAAAQVHKATSSSVKAIYDDGRGARRARRAEPLHLRLRRGRRAATAERQPPVAGRRRPPPSRQPASPRSAQPMKVAYWPGCVSRGFTPELHGSMAQDRAAARHRARRARPRVLLRRRRHRRAQPGARRHAQRAHLRARPAGRRAPT